MCNDCNETASEDTKNRFVRNRKYAGKANRIPRWVLQTCRSQI